MKTKIFYITAFVLALTFSACTKHDQFFTIDNQPPSPPTDLRVLNGDGRVDLSWNLNPERDVAGYNIYFSYSYDGKYSLIGSTQNDYYTDYGAKNGNTYYYAVAAYDFNGNESELSYDEAYATPRPEGFNQSIFDYRAYPDLGGFSFTSYSTVPYDDSTADFFFENYQGTYYLDVWNDTDIQDMGKTQDIYDIPYAPLSGWSTTKDAIVIPGHTYVIWTWDNHYAKVRVKSLTSDRIVFDWSFQLVKGNTDLKQQKTNVVRKPIDKSIHERNNK